MSIDLVLWCFHTSHMLLNKFGNKLLKLLLNLIGNMWLV